MATIASANSATPSLQATLSRTRVVQARREAEVAEATAQDLRSRAEQAERQATDSQGRASSLSRRADQEESTYSREVQARRNRSSFQALSQRTGLLLDLIA
jgi:hypothetical protein